MIVATPFSQSIKDSEEGRDADRESSAPAGRNPGARPRKRGEDFWGELLGHPCQPLTSPFYRERVIYTRGTMLWQVDLNGFNHTRLFPRP